MLSFENLLSLKVQVQVVHAVVLAEPRRFSGGAARLGENACLALGFTLLTDHDHA